MTYPFKKEDIDPQSAQLQTDMTSVDNRLSVLVSHPGQQHSHQLAWALYEQGLLKAFWCGVPVLGDGEAMPFWIPASYARRIKRVGIPPHLKRHPLFFQALIRASRLLPRQFSREDYTHRVFHLFDWWVARHVVHVKPKVVIAYENSAYHTFRAAKAIGARCILDAPSMHHTAMRRLMSVEPTPYLAEINRRKDEEISAANLILTCSPLAAESYVEAGVPRSKVQPILLGSTLSPGIESWQRHSRPLHFVFAGALRYLKSIDLILTAFRRLHQDGSAYQLSFVGGQGERGWVERIETTASATYCTSMPQQDLFAFLAKADCLLLPSRFDSFGMVVAEAMAYGTPAIVSSQTGAKAMIELFPGSGWVVECTADSLYQCLKERIQNRETLFAARERAKEASRHFTWQAYRERVGSLVQDWMS